MRLHRRIVAASGTHEAAMSGYSQVSGSAASPGGAPAVMPLAQVLTFPGASGAYSVLAYRGLAPVFTADGAAVPASAPGRWGQLAAAGGGRHG